MHLPVIPISVAPLWLQMEKTTYYHIPIATIITAFMLLAPILAYVGLKRKDLRPSLSGERTGMPFSPAGSRATFRPVNE